MRLETLLCICCEASSTRSETPNEVDIREYHIDVNASKSYWPKCIREYDIIRNTAAEKEAKKLLSPETLVDAFIESNGVFDPAAFTSTRHGAHAVYTPGNPIPDVEEEGILETTTVRIDSLKVYLVRIIRFRPKVSRLHVIS